MGRPIRVALVGCGRIARVHRSYLEGLATVALAGAWDSDASARDAFANETGIRVFATLEELLETGGPDVAHILTPPLTHAPLAMKLLEAGVNVLVEKPFASTTADADRVLAVAQRCGRWVTADHNRWFDPVVQQAAQMLAGGQLGKLVGVEVFQGAEIGEREARGHWSTNLPGGSLHNLASHALYLMRRFAGPVRDLRVIARVGPGDALEEVRLVAMGEQAPASVTLSVRTRPFTNRLTLYGTEATVEVNLNNMTLVERRPRQLPKLLNKVWPNLSEASQLLTATVRNAVAFAVGRQRFYPGIGAHLRVLYEQVAVGNPPPVTAAEARDVVAWYDEILTQCGIGASTYPTAVPA